MRRRDSVFYEG